MIFSVPRVGASRRLQRSERGFRIAVGQVGHALLFNQITLAG